MKVVNLTSVLSITLFLVTLVFTSCSVDISIELESDTILVSYSVSNSTTNDTLILSTFNFIIAGKSGEGYSVIEEGEAEFMLPVTLQPGKSFSDYGFPMTIPLASVRRTNDKYKNFQAFYSGSYIKFTLTNSNKNVEVIISGFEREIKDVGKGIYGLVYEELGPGYLDRDIGKVYSSLFPGKIIEVQGGIGVNFATGIHLCFIVNENGVQVIATNYDGTYTSVAITNIEF